MRNTPSWRVGEQGVGEDRDRRLWRVDRWPGVGAWLDGRINLNVGTSSYYETVKYEWSTYFLILVAVKSTAPFHLCRP
jgi:hypothetical protein